jgi:UDP-glucose 4-epimerase
MIYENSGHRRRRVYTSHIVELFQQRAEVRVLDNLRSGFRHNLAPFRHELIAASILDSTARRCARRWRAT